MLFNWDAQGAILTNEGSNGDSAHHTAYYYFMDSVLTGNNNFNGLSIFYRINPDGEVEFMRHPDRTSEDFSRDQFTPFLACLSLNDAAHFESHIDHYYKQIKWNYGIFFNRLDSDGTDKPWWNRDILDPTTMALHNRGEHLRSPFIYFGDAHLLTSVIFRIIKVRNSPSSTADENLIINLMVAKMNRPTWISDLAAKIYFKYRPDNDGGKGWRGAMIDFWSRNGTYVPGLAGLTIKAVEKVFGRECY